MTTLPSDHESETGLGLPDRPIERFTRPLQRFLHVEATSGIVLLAATAVALALANTAAAEWYRSFWDQTLRLGVDAFELSYPLSYWVNDALMVIFFFVVGLEIKREVAAGELSDRRKLALPVAAALGGAALPVGIFLLVSRDHDAGGGWAVPMATDIAFVVGCVALLGPRVPRGLKIFLLALAIVDDILAVLVIALFFTANLKLAWLAGAVIVLGLMVIMRVAGVRAISVYFVAGVAMWLCTLKSGIHPTVAGVVLGLMAPSQPWLRAETFKEVLAEAWQRMTGSEGADLSTMQRAAFGELAFAANEAVSPLERLETTLHPWVAFVIMPVFALANAGIALEASALSSPIALAVAAGLFVGKPVGITLAAWVVVKAGLAKLPTGVSWPMVASGSVLAGIGFTMAIFIAALGLEGDSLLAAKGGVLLGSAASAVIGMTALGLVLRSSRQRLP